MSLHYPIILIFIISHSRSHIVLVCSRCRNRSLNCIVLISVSYGLKHFKELVIIIANQLLMLHKLRVGEIQILLHMMMN
jgi:hypothetical protein